MKKMKLNLQFFTGSSVTLYKDAGVTTFTASPNSSVAKDAEVTLTVVFASGYELDEYEVIAGGVTVDPATKKFTMGEADVVINLKSKANNKYKIVESCDVIINGTKTSLTKNTKIIYSANGAIAGVECSGTAITLDAETVKQLVKDGIIVKI